MFKFNKLAAACAVVALASTAAPAIAAPYTAPSVEGTATVRLYDAIELLKVTDIDFGTVIRDASYAGGSSIAMAADGSTDCASVLGMSCTGATSAGAFTIRGDSGSDMSVRLDSTDYNPVTNELTLNNAGNSASVVLNLSFAGMTQDAGLNTFSVSGTGSATDITLYGSLDVPDSASAPNGVYSSTFDLTADYK